MKSNTTKKPAVKARRSRSFHSRSNGFLTSGCCRFFSSGSAACLSGRSGGTDESAERRAKPLRIPSATSETPPPRFGRAETRTHLESRPGCVPVSRLSVVSRHPSGVFLLCEDRPGLCLQETDYVDGINVRCGSKSISSPPRTTAGRLGQRRVHPPGRECARDGRRPHPDPRGRLLQGPQVERLLHLAPVRLQRPPGR